MSCICCIRTSHQDLPAFVSGSVYEVKQHASQLLRRKQVCADLWEKEKPSLLSVRQSELGVPKWDGKQWLSCHAVSQKYLWFPMNLPAEAELQMLSQFWRDAGLWKSACIYAEWLCKRMDVHRKTSTCFIGETKEKKKCMVKGLESEQLF